MKSQALGAPAQPPADPVARSVRGGALRAKPARAEPPEPPEAHRKVASWTRGLDNGFTQAIELVAASVLVGLIGAWLDRRLGTRPVLTLGFGALALAGAVVKVYFGYVHQMEAEEADKPWAAERRRSP